MLLKSLNMLKSSKLRSSLERFDIKIKHEQYAKHTLREKMQFNAIFHAKYDIIYLWSIKLPEIK